MSPINNYIHWRRSALNSAGALQGGGGEFRGIYTPFYTIKFRGGPKSGGACAPAAPASSAPMIIYVRQAYLYLKTKYSRYYQSLILIKIYVVYFIDGILI